MLVDLDDNNWSFDNSGSMGRSVQDNGAKLTSGSAAKLASFYKEEWEENPLFVISLSRTR